MPQYGLCGDAERAGYDEVVFDPSVKLTPIFRILGIVNTFPVYDVRISYRASGLVRLLPIQGWSSSPRLLQIDSSITFGGDIFSIVTDLWLLNLLEIFWSLLLSY